MGITGGIKGGYLSRLRSAMPHLQFCYICFSFSLLVISLFCQTIKSPRREVVRSSAGAGVIYPPFLGSFA